MRFRLSIAAVLVLSVVAGGAGPARALTPIDPGDFTVTMDKPLEGASETQPATVCSVSGQSMTIQAYVDNVVSRWNQQGASPPTAACTMSRTTVLSNAPLTGSVVNKTAGNGSMAQTCDMKRQVDISFTLTAVISASGRSVTASSFSNKMAGFQACAWAMTFADAKHSRLSGTIEQTFEFADAGAAVECPASYAGLSSQGTVYCVTVQANAKVYVVGGSGEFSDTGGEGDLSNTDVAGIVIPKTGSVQGSSFRALSSGILFPTGLLAVDSTATANSLKLALLKGAKASVRLVSPASNGTVRSLGAGPDGSSQTKVKVSAAPGAACAITAKSGKKSAVLLKAVKDADGVIATSITAALVKGKLSVKTGAKVTLGLSCAVGKTSAKSTQSVTVGA